MEDNYIKFALYTENWLKIKQDSKYVFQDNECIINSKRIPNLILQYVTNYNLEDLELILRLSGINSFSIEEMPQSFCLAKTYSLLDEKSCDDLSKEEAIKEIEDVLGNGIIDKYNKFKLHQKKQRLEVLHNHMLLIKKEQSKLNKEIKEVNDTESEKKENVLKLINTLNNISKQN